MLVFKENQRSQDLSVPNVAQLKLVTGGTSTRKVGASKPKNKAKMPEIQPQEVEAVANWQTSLANGFETRITQRAYEIYEERCRIGASLQDWLRAEREVLAELEYES